MRLWALALLLGSVSLAAELSSAAVMYLLPNFYLAITDDNQSQFWSLISLSLLLISIVSLLYSLKTYFSGLCQVNWRWILVKYVHSNLASIFSKSVSNTDQRVTQDIDNFCIQLAEVLEKLAVSPLMILFYSIYVGITFGAVAVLACFLYFAVGSCLSQLLSNYIVPLIYELSQYEGDFRLHHSGYMLHHYVISLLGGGKSEVRAMSSTFTKLINTKLSIVRKKLHLNLVTNWFAQAGGIVNYIVVGGAIFYYYPTDSSSERIVLLARGSFACMNLIYSFSTVLSCCSIYTNVRGLHKRLEEIYDMNIRYLLLYEQVMHFPCSNMWCMRCSKSKKRQGSRSCCGATGWGYDSLDADEESSSSVLEQGLLMSNMIDNSSSDVKNELSISSNSTHLRNNIPSNSNNTYRMLIRDLSLDFTNSMQLLITGKSGVGKSTLLQYIAQSIVLDENDPSNTYAIKDVVPSLAFHVLYCPQSPYHQAQESIWDYLAYPDNVEELISQNIESYLQSLHTATIILKLDKMLFGYDISHKIPTVEEWRKALQSKLLNCMSTGEKQLLGIARCVIKKMVASYSKQFLLLLDECTSALDDDAENIVYGVIKNYFPFFISIGHRAAIRSFHNHELYINEDSSYTVKRLEPPLYSK